MKLGNTTLLDRCAGGVKLPKQGPCPECGSENNAPCGKRVSQLAAVERAARRLIKEGLRLTPCGLIVRESADRSDPHHELCTALEAIEPLNPNANAGVTP